MHDSACPNKELCGSCIWSDIAYDEQLRQKLGAINQALIAQGVPLQCETILPSPRTAHYRNRMDFKIDFEGRVGLHQKGKWWRVIDNHCCFISDYHIEHAFSLVREWTQTCGLSYFDRKKHHGFLRYAVIRATRSGDTLVSIVTSKPNNSEERILAEKALYELSQRIAPAQVVWAINFSTSDTSVGDENIAIGGNGYLVERILDFNYRISPNAFFQTNSYAAPLLLDTVCEFARTTKTSSLLDLYCGSGFFSIALGSLFSRVTGVEVVASAIEDARYNAKLNNVTIDFQCLKSEDLDLSSMEADCWIVDPPRAGLHKTVLSHLVTSGPPQLVYVSCNFKNLALELVSLLNTYSVTALRAIDMFPHTPHVEVVANLKRKW